jgi:hypothetical protein
MGSALASLCCFTFCRMTSFCSNCEWSRQYVNAPFFSRFSSAIELDVDGQNDGDERDASTEDANIRAAQAILFRSRSKTFKEVQHAQSELKVTPRPLGPVTPSKGVFVSLKEKPVPIGNAEATPVKMAIDLTAVTPSSASSASGSKQRLHGLVWLKCDVAA